MFSRRLTIPMIFALVFVGPSSLFAQKNDADIEAGRLITYDIDIAKQILPLHQSGKLKLDKQTCWDTIKTPKHTHIELPPPLTTPLQKPELYRLAKKAHVRIGWAMNMGKPELWSYKLGGGYALTNDGAIATCFHVVNIPAHVEQDAWMIAVTSDYHVYPVSRVITTNEQMDTAIVKVDGLETTPLALSDDVSPGDSSFVYSDPFGLRGFFSDGIVNRLYWQKETMDPRTLEGASSYRLDLGNNWAQGSSGSAVLNQFGNAIGHTESVSPLSEKQVMSPHLPVSATVDETTMGPFFSTVMFIKHEAIPARAVRLLIEDNNAKCQK